MKKIFALMTIALLAMTSFSLQSCDDDDNDYVPATYAVVTVKPNADNSSFVMQLNDSVQMMASNMVTSPFGTKALGEPPTCSGAPAIRNAIAQATGVYIDRCPITPHVLYAQLREAGVLTE